MRIVVTNFGGLIPKAQPRALPDNAGQTATNLMPTVAEFRPMAGDSTVVTSSGVNNPATIYRLKLKSDGTANADFATGWKVYAASVNLVRGPLNDNAKEWTYLSYNNGSAAPRVIDVDGGDRQLGVPAPTTAPTVAVTTTDEFTEDERNAAIDTAFATALKAIKGAITQTWVGSTVPGGGGYYARTTANGFTPEDKSQRARVFRLEAAGGSIANAYVGTIPAAAFTWALDPGLSPFPVTLGGDPHIAIAYPAYGMTYTVDEAALSTALQAIDMPGKTDGTKLLTGDQADELAAEFTEYLDPTVGVVKSSVDALKTKALELEQVLNGGDRSSMGSVMADFYLDSEVAGAFTNAIAVAAESAWKLADTMAHSSPYTWDPP